MYATVLGLSSTPNATGIQHPTKPASCSGRSWQLRQRASIDTEGTELAVKILIKLLVQIVKIHSFFGFALALGWTCGFHKQQKSLAQQCAAASRMPNFSGRFFFAITHNTPSERKLGQGWHMEATINLRPSFGWRCSHLQHGLNRCPHGRITTLGVNSLPQLFNSWSINWTL